MQVLSHCTHFCRHYLYLFWSTLHSVADFPNHISLLVYYTDQTTAIKIPFCASNANFSMLTPNQYLSLKPSITYFFHFSKISSEFLVQKWRKWYFGERDDEYDPHTYQLVCFQWYQEMHNKIGGQMQLGYASIIFVPETSVVNKRTICRQITHLRLSSYIIKCVRNTAVDLIGHLKKLVS